MKHLVRIPIEYFDVIPVGTKLFSPLYQFENGLRIAIHKFLSTCYSEDWWEISLQTRLPRIYEYAEEQKRRRDLMPWIGASTEIEILPIHLITLGQLEEIVKAYQSDCIPQLFPTMEFFLGHMECIKRVRNLFSHMVPCLTQEDTQLARGEIRALSSHINTRL